MEVQAVVDPAPVPKPQPVPSWRTMNLKLNGTMIGLALVLGVLGVGYWQGRQPAVDPVPVPVPTDPAAIAITIPLKKMSVIKLPTLAAGTKVFWINPEPEKLQDLQYPDHASICPQVAGPLYLAADTFLNGTFKRISWAITANDGPMPPPDVDPVDPHPVDPTPKPDPKLPIPGPGIRVLVVYEATAGDKLLTTKQKNELWGKELNAYAASHCAKGPDGKTPEFRIWDKDADVSKVAKVWQDAFHAPRASVPWMTVYFANGVVGFSGPLPDGGILDAIKKVGGP